MVIATPQPPDGARQIVHAALAARAHRSSHLPPLRGAPQTGSPIPVYVVDQPDVADLRAPSLTSARRVGWRYPVTGGAAHGLAALFEVDGTLRFAGIGHGHLADRLFEAAELAERTLYASPERFEARILDIPSLRICALWLHGPSDHFIVVADGQRGVAEQLFIESDITPRIAAARARVGAHARLAVDGPRVATAPATSWWTWGKENLPLATAAFYLYVSLVGLIYNWIFFHAFDVNVLYFYDITDFVLSGLKWPAILAVCLVVPIVNHAMIGWLVDRKHNPRTANAVIGYLSIVAISLVVLEAFDVWNLPLILYVASAACLAVPLLGMQCFRSRSVRPRFVTISTASCSILLVIMVAAVWAISNAGAYFDSANAQVIAGKRPEPGGAREPANPSAGPWRMIGSTQKVVFFLDTANARILALPWDDVKQISLACVRGPKQFSGACLQPLDGWSRPRFKFLWPFVTR